MGSCCSSETITPGNEADLLSRDKITLSETQTHKLIKLQAWWRGNQTRKEVKLRKGVADGYNVGMTNVQFQNQPENFNNPNVKVSNLNLFICAGQERGASRLCLQ